MLDFATKVLTAKGTCLFSVGQAGFIIKSESGQLLGIDLYLSNCVERVEGNTGFKRLLPQILNPSDLNFNVIICTHPHLDHFDIDAVPEMISHGAKLFCSIDCEKLVRQTQMEKYYKNQITYIKSGNKITAGDFKLSFVNCDHGSSAPDAVGVVIEVDGKTIYEAGDTCLRLDRIAEIPENLDVLIAPINGMYGNMNASEAVALTQALKPAIIIPCHYGMFASHGGDLKEFYDLMSKDNKYNNDSNKYTSLLLMQQGEKYTIAQ